MILLFLPTRSHATVRHPIQPEGTGIGKNKAIWSLPHREGTYNVLSQNQNEGYRSYPRSQRREGMKPDYIYFLSNPIRAYLKVPNAWFAFYVSKAMMPYRYFLQVFFECFTRTEKYAGNMQEKMKTHCQILNIKSNLTYIMLIPSILKDIYKY